MYSYKIGLCTYLRFHHMLNPILILNQEAWICLRTPSSSRLLRSLQIHLADNVVPSPWPRKTCSGYWDAGVSWLMYETHNYCLYFFNDALCFIF